MIKAVNLKALTSSVTKKWTRARRAEERGNRSRAHRATIYSKGLSFIDAAETILPAGYAHASGNGQYTVPIRQLFYSCREGLLNITDRNISANYFSQVLLVKFMKTHPAETADWKITASPRGALTLPNTATEVRIPCGTVEIDEYLAKPSTPCDLYAERLDSLCPLSPANRRAEAGDGGGGKGPGELSENHVQAPWSCEGPLFALDLLRHRARASKR
jgi:hypothetical protein